MLTNEAPNGGMGRFDDTLAMGVRFQEAGYRTAHIGKYLNGYTDEAPYIPPGWDLFASPLVHEDWNAWQLAEGSSTVVSSTGTMNNIKTYVTDYLHERAMAWLREDTGAPFFLWLTQMAPHYPAFPADEYEGACGGESWRGGAFNEADISDKPSHWQAHGLISDADMARNDLRYAQNLETLLSVDDSLAMLMDELEASGRLENTLIVFTSDNGFMWGEHRVNAKSYPYQESIRVPLVVRMPGGVVGVNDHIVSANLDVPATFYALAGLEDAPTSGMSLLPLLLGQPVTWRERLLIEGFNLVDAPTYAGLVGSAWKYVEHVGGELELYDLQTDPIEELNLASDPAYADIMAELAADLQARRGLAIAETQVVLALGAPADHCIQVWGGTAPFSWQVVGGELPEGLSLGQDGCLAGVPTAPGGSLVNVQVTDSGQSPDHGGPQVHQDVLWLGAVC